MNEMDRLEGINPGITLGPAVVHITGVGRGYANFMGTERLAHEFSRLDWIPLGACELFHHAVPFHHHGYLGSFDSIGSM